MVEAAHCHVGILVGIAEQAVDKSGYLAFIDLHIAHAQFQPSSGSWMRPWQSRHTALRCHAGGMIPKS